MMKKLAILCSLIFLNLFASGCAYFIDYLYVPPPEDTANELWEAGLMAMKEKKYSNAIEYFLKIKDRYPFSPYTVNAEIALADAYYLDEQYEAAEETYKDFESMHPRHERTPYILLQIGMSNFRQIKTIDLPQDNLREALEFFNRVRETYPGSPEAGEASKHITQCRRKMAEYELFVAEFYFKRELYGSSWERYLYTMETFRDLPDIVQFARRRADVAYLKYQENQADLDREKREGSWKRWFDWL